MTRKQCKFGALALAALFGLAASAGGWVFSAFTSKRETPTLPKIPLAGGRTHLGFPQQEGGAAPKRGAEALAIDDYRKLALAFEPNWGQAHPQVKFLGRARGYAVFLTPTEAVVALKGSQARGLEGKHELAPPGMRTQSPALARMKLLGADPSPEAVGLEELPGKSNYFMGSDAKKWRTNIPNYAKVRYANVYPGISLVYYGNRGQLEYDFVVARGADPRLIRFEFRGADNLSFGSQGDLVGSVAGEEIRLHKPVAYQQLAGARHPISARYVRRGKRQFSFEIGGYDAGLPLVIDPVLSYSTYLGGSGNDAAEGIAVDSSGNAYVTGRTFSMDFPKTPGAFETSFFVRPGVFVTKLNATGSALLYSTYFGGSGGDYVGSVAVDSSGNAYVAGGTFSLDFPTTPGAFQRGPRLLPDAFVTKLNAAGNALVYSTYLGGSGGEVQGITGFGRTGIAVDASGSAYVAGLTASPDFPTTPAAFQSSFGGGLGSGSGDAFVTKLNAAGSALVYSTYLGGGRTDRALDVAVDSSGNAYVFGSTDSTNFPSTPGAFRGTFAGGGADAFVSKLNTAGDGLVYSTYLGGRGSEGFDEFPIAGIAVDSSGNAYVTGSTFSPDFPTTPGVFQAALRSVPDAFLTKLNSTGTGLVYSSYLGGLGTDIGFGIAVDGAGNAYVTGATDSSNFPITPDALQTALRGELAAFLTKWNATATALLYSTYLGGNVAEFGFGVAVDSSGNAYVTGHTFSTNFPTTPGAFQTALKAENPSRDGDGFIVKFGEAAGSPPLPPRARIPRRASTD